MSSEITVASTEVLHKLISLSEAEQHWAVKQYFSKLDDSGTESLAKLLQNLQDIGIAVGIEAQIPVYAQAKECLLESTQLAAVEKVLLAVVIISTLYEVETFHSRQVTETLRDASNSVGNVTAALNGLIARGDVGIQPDDSGGHKRYHITDDGHKRALSLIGDVKQVQHLPERSSTSS